MKMRPAFFAVLDDEEENSCRNGEENEGIEAPGRRDISVEKGMKSPLAAAPGAIETGQEPEQALGRRFCSRIVSVIEYTEKKNDSSRS